MPTKDHCAAITMILIVWGLAGTLFGALFTALYGVCWVFELPGWQCLMIATAIAGMLTSAFYSAMPVALVGSMAGVLASIGYLMASGLRIDLVSLVGLAGVAGVLAGSLYAWTITRGSRPLAEMLNGLFAGMLAGAVLVLTFALTGWQTNMLILAAVAVTSVGTVFQLSEPWLVEDAVRWLPAALSAPVVAGLIAAIVGVSIWFVGGATTLMLDAQLTSRFAGVASHIPHGLFGGLLGGAITGVLLELLGFHLEESHQA